MKNARTVRTTITTLSLIDDRREAEKELKTLDAVAADPYATMRSVYLPSRKAEISGQEPELERPLTWTTSPLPACRHKDCLPALRRDRSPPSLRWLTQSRAPRRAEGF